VNQFLPAFLLSAAFVCLGAFSAPARADLWVFVDDDGKVNFSHQQEDPRYQLFIKGETQNELKTGTTDLKYLPAPGKLEDHIIYKRIQKTPNVKKYEALVAQQAQLQRLDPALVKAVIAVESAYDPAAVSEKGAIGLMQLIPETAERYGVKAIANPKDNINGGTRYLKDLIAMFNGDLPLALAGYNAGEGAVKRYNNTIPPFPETRQYVQLVMQFYEHFGGRGTVTRTKDGRVRLTLPGRRNLPPSPGEKGLGELARDPRAEGLFKAAPAPGVAPGGAQ